MRYPKKPTYRYFIQKDGKQMNVDELTPEQREIAGRWAYQTLVRALGFVPVDENDTKET